MNIAKLKLVAIGAALVVVVVATLVWWQTGMLASLLDGKAAHGEPISSSPYPLPELIALDDGAFGLKLSKIAIESLELKPLEIELATKPIPLPPLIGTINYDNERLFTIKPRFAGEVAEVRTVEEPKEVLVNGSTTYKPCQRPIKFGDKVKQGDVLAVIWSRDLGEKKAALVDALCVLRLSQDTLERQRKIYAEGALSEAAFKQTENKVQTDRNAVMTAERTLRMWKLTDEEIKTIWDEAKNIHDQKAKRDVLKDVQKWARVEITVPWFTKDPKKPNDSGEPGRELTILEKNTHLNDMVDPANFGTPMFRVADLSRVQIWAHPPEELMPLIRERLKAGRGALKWRIRFQSEAAQTRELILDVAQVSHSLEPNQHTPMLIGYLDNPEGKYLIGQFVTATILAAPPLDTVEVPTAAINPLNGQEFVFVERKDAPDQFLIRRVSVVQSFMKTSLVRTKLTAEQERANLDVAEGKYKIQPLQPGERVVTRGVVELTAALEELRNTKKEK